MRKTIDPDLDYCSADEGDAADQTWVQRLGGLIRSHKVFLSIQGVLLLSIVISFWLLFST